MKFLNLIPNSPEWEAYRLKVIGASDVPAILGISPWTTRQQLWEYKMGLIIPIVNAAMRRGTNLEARARMLFEDYIGKKMIPRVIEHAEHPFLIASLDGISEDETMICEIKCTNRKTHEESKKGIISPHYMAQIQTQLACTGLPMCYYVSFDGDDIHTHIVPRDNGMIDKIIEACQNFYNVNMLGFESPEPNQIDFFNELTEGEKE